MTDFSPLIVLEARSQNQGVNRAVLPMNALTDPLNKNHSLPPPIASTGAGQSLAASACSCITPFSTSTIYSC